ncbi:anthocyanidin 3-O-glucosyltransferase 2-like [Amaranthus tricolor]|nr:anthocyanidin 3-O-glucosyltransferase 2-like [Amaranthus tricolor]
MTSSSTMELVFIPTPGMGHLLSTVNMAKLILQRDHRFSIFILVINFPMSFSTLSAFIQSQKRENQYPTRLIFHTLPPLSNSPDPSSPAFFQTYLDLQKPLIKHAIEERIRSGSPKLSGLILDMFCLDMSYIADEFQVPWYVFYTSGANLMNVLLHFQSMADDEGVDIFTQFENPDTEFVIPGFVNRLRAKNFPASLVDKERGSTVSLKLARGLRKSKGILINTFVELETIGTDALFDLVANGSIPPVYPVGPILELGKNSTSGSHQDYMSIMKWLDDQPCSSVVFLCFGSMGSFDADQVKEIANGLEKSGYRFLWSLRKPPPEGKFAKPSEDGTFEDALPEGFMDRTAERGKIIGWAPQVSILEHSAIGGFVLHCGWNSTLESLWFGVPMATWPLYAEQQLNAFSLVKELGLAVEIRMDYRRDFKTFKANFQVSAEEVEYGVRRLMCMDDEARKRVKEIREKSRKALEDGGSSYKSLGIFIQDIVSN